jgi:hypothetical protein
VFKKRTPKTFAMREHQLHGHAVRLSNIRVAVNLPGPEQIAPETSLNQLPIVQDRPRLRRRKDAQAARQ